MDEKNNVEILQGGCNNRTELLLEKNDDKTELLFEAPKTITVDYNSRALAKGTILNSNYEIQSIIGEGGFGITYRAFDKYLKINVAIKEYFPAQFAVRNTATGSNNLIVISGSSSLNFENGLRNYMLEANKLSKLGSLNGIVSVLNYFEENQTAYMVMEYVEGETLKEYLNRNGGKISYSQTLKMMKPVIESLQEIHMQGIIHRDISPDNIMISPNGEMTIIDFGAARNDEDEKSKTIMLKQGYAPPEQYFRNGRQGTWTDIYALCSTMFRMITGEKMPDALSIKARPSSKPQISDYIKGVPEKITKVIDRGTSVSIEDRIKTASELAEYLYKESRLKISNRKKKRIITCAFICFLMVVMVFGGAYVAVSILAPMRDMVNDTQESGTSTKVKGGGEKKSEDGEVPQTFKNVTQLTSSQIIYSETDEGIVIKGVVDDVAEIEIPRRINGKDVVAINGIGANTITLVIPNSVKKISDNAFKGCVYLERVYIPKSVSEISSTAFNNCLSLSEVVVSDKNIYFYVQDNSLYNAEGELIVSW